MSRRTSEGWSTPATLLAAAITSLITLSNAHQSIAFPTPISFDLACRIGLGRNCPGPCPTHLLRNDQTPNNPSVTVRRGGVLPVHVLKNNHVGGFSRWSLVKVSDMYSKKKHAESSFLFTCGDNLVTFCTKENQERNCKVDRMNQYYRHFLRIPKVYPDGFYVLGWIWYGGAVSTGRHGAFGDYYDCVYVRIKGGPIEDSYQPVFEPGQTMTGRDGMCRATTNRVGHCYREPCPFGNRLTTLMKPAEFERKRPTRILRKSFERHNNKASASNVLKKGNLSSADYKPTKPTNKVAPRPSARPTPKPFSKPSKKPSQPVKPTSSPKPSPGKKKRVTKNSVTTKAATGASSKPSSAPTPKPTSRPTSNATGKQTSKQASKPAKPTAKPSSSLNNKNSSGSGSSGNAQSGETKESKGKHQIEGRMAEPMGTPNPTTTLKPNADAKKIAKQQRRREKKLRQKAKMRERREKKLRKAGEKKAKLEAKRLRRKKIKEERAIKKEKQREEKQRKKQEQKARKLARKEAKREAKRKAKRETRRRSKRSFPRVQEEDNGMEYDDCFVEGIFPRDNGHIDYGDPVTPPLPGN